MGDWQAARSNHGFFSERFGVYSTKLKRSEDAAISSNQSARFGLFLFGLFCVEALLALLPDGLLITGHEGDLLHMLEIALRMVDGELPHLDFMTPIGILGFAPVAGWISAGFMAGEATLLANLSVAAVLLPAIWWVGASRLSLPQAVFFGAFDVILLVAVVYGGNSSLIALSLYYSRWAWGITFVVLATVLFPARVNLGERWVAPIVVGAGMAALAMLKMTYFVPLAPAILLILLTRKQAAHAGKSLLVGLVIFGSLVAWLGVDFFVAYFENLLTLIDKNSGRAEPDQSFMQVVAGHGSILGTFVLLTSIVLFRKSGRLVQGQIILILAPVFTYITYQNWGNDPKWLVLLMLYLWVNLPDKAGLAVWGLPPRASILALICIAGTVIFPSVNALVTSPFRAAFASKEAALRLPIPEGVADIWLPESQALVGVSRQLMAGMPALPITIKPVEIEGFSFPMCSSIETVVPIAMAMAQELEALDEVRGKPVMQADSLNSIWLFGDIGRVKGAAPWYYGDTSGLENADFLLVPMCPREPRLRAQMVGQFQNGGYGLSEVYRSALLVLYRVTKPSE